ncbi:MAG: hypothetical protein WD768_08455 [Phycisphaeraceae bacterium]
MPFPRCPYRLLTIHTALILFFMFTLSQRWFLEETPYDCFYLPFILTSGPVVYFIAHDVQHFSERFFTPEQVMISWNLVPGMVCLILGGLQWYLIERFFMYLASEDPETFDSEST